MTQEYILMQHDKPIDKRSFRDIEEAREYFNKKYLITDDNKLFYLIALIKSYHSMTTPKKK